MGLKAKDIEYVYGYMIEFTYVIIVKILNNC